LLEKFIVNNSKVYNCKVPERKENTISFLENGDGI
jgi:hypothetical protein